jgi:zinc protease
MAFVAVVILAQTAPAGTGPLLEDPTLVRGKLDNGLRYIIRKHANPPGKMAFILNIDTGSLNETDEQKGIAHFLEHLAFNGSENFPPGKVVEYFESIGMEFGDDLNAFTSFDQTAYMLFTPNVEIPTMERALLCLSDQAFRLLLLEEEIEKERGVILAEWQSGKSPQQRIRDDLWPRLFLGSRFAERMPIGDEKLIATFPRDEFVSYYRTWYRPEKMVLIAVGDANPKAVIPLIEKQFGGYRATMPAAEPAKGGFIPFPEPRALLATDPDIATAEVEMLTILPGRPPVTTEEQFRLRLVDRVGSWILGRRMEEQIQKGKAGYRSGGVQIMDFLNEVTLVAGSASGEPQNWKRMLDELIFIVNQARQHGFTEKELGQARKEFLANAELAVERESTRPARSFLMRYNRAVNDRDTILAAADQLALYKKLLPSITLNDVNRTFARAFAPGKFAYVVTLPERDDLKTPTEAEILAGVQTALAQKTEPVIEENRPDTLLAEQPKPAQIVEQTVDEDLGITTARLSNNVQVHHRYMDYEKDKVLVAISLAGGSIEETPESRGVTEVAALVFNRPATGRLTSTDVRDLITGTTFSLRGSDRPDQLRIVISGSPEDMETALQLAHALLTDGRLEQSVFDNWRTATLERIEAGKASPGYQLRKALQKAIAGRDHRLHVLERENVEAQSPALAQAWFNRMARKSVAEVAVVGDIQKDKALALVAKYLGSLPPRPATAEHLDPLRHVARDPGPYDIAVSFESQTPVSVVLCGFLSCEAQCVADARALDLASNVLSTRMIKDIREEKQLVYSIGAVSQPSRSYWDSGLFFGAAKADPAKAERLADEVVAALKAFAETGPTAEELEVAKKQIANDMDEQRRRPRYWLGVLADFDLHRKSLADIKADAQAYANLTVEEVRAAFNKYHRPDRMLRVVVTPQEQKAAAAMPAKTR